MSKLPTIILLTILFIGCGQGTVSLSQQDDLWVLSSPEEYMPQGEAVGACSVEFLSDGQLRGYTPCSTFYGSYITKGSRINIRVSDVGLNPCADFKAQNDYIQRLCASTKFVVTPSNHLLLLNQDSTDTLTFRLSAGVGGEK